MTKCLIDLDDTLGDFKDPLMKALNKATGKRIHWSKWTNFDVPELYEISHDDFLDICIKEKVIENTKVNETSASFLSDLKYFGYHNILITARGWHPNGRELTEQWLSDNELIIDEVIVVDVHQSKVDSIAHIDGIEFSVDDRIKHCREYMQSNKVKYVVLYDAPWNSYMNRWNHFWGGYDYHMRVDDLTRILPNITKYGPKIKNMETSNVRQVCG